MLCLCALASHADAAIVANFTGGLGTESSDQWAGVAGDGWTTPWSTNGRNSNTTAIVTTTPLTTGGGNYLGFVDDSSNTSITARRAYGSGNGVDISQNYRISFNYRFDGSVAQFADFGDRIALLGDTASVNGTTSTNTWIVGVAASNTGSQANQSVFPGNWYFFDNNGDSDFATKNMYDTGLAMVAGTVYQITVDVNPLAGTYGASVSDGTSTVSQGGLTFRRGASSIASATEHYINFGGTNSSASDNGSFSVDNILIVPEPSVVLLAALGGLFLLRRQR